MYMKYKSKIENTDLIHITLQTSSILFSFDWIKNLYGLSQQCGISMSMRKGVKGRDFRFEICCVIKFKKK